MIPIIGLISQPLIINKYAFNRLQSIRNSYHVSI